MLCGRGHRHRSDEAAAGRGHRRNSCRHGQVRRPVFHDQNFTDEQQLAFTQSLGPLELAIGTSLRRPKDHRLPTTFADVSNLDRDNKPFARDDRRRLFAIGNRLWHSDSSFKVIPAKYSLLHARSIPSKGGNTEFAYMPGAYDALDQETKDLIEDLVCEHSQMYSRAKLGFTDFTPEERERFKPVRQRLVRTHPTTGRKSLYLSSHAGTIIGWPEPEAKALLMDLTRPPPTPVRLFAQVAGRRSRHVGQPRDHAPRAPVPAQRAARRPPHHAHGRRTDRRAAGGVVWPTVGAVGASRPPRRHVEKGALVGRALAHVGVAVGAEHVDGAGHGLVVGALAGHQRDAGLHLVADPQHQADGAAIVEKPHLLPVGEAAGARVVGVQDAAGRALALAQEGDGRIGGVALEVAGRGQQPQRPAGGVGLPPAGRAASRASAEGPAWPSSRE